MYSNELQVKVNAVGNWFGRFGVRTYRLYLAYCRYYMYTIYVYTEKDLIHLVVDVSDECLWMDQRPNLSYSLCFSS